MHCSQTVRRKSALPAVAALLGLSCAVGHAQPSADFSGTSALAFTAKAVSFGPRPPGSAAIGQLRDYIVSQLRLRRCEVTIDPFTAQTPNGPVQMRNIIARFAGASGKAVAVTGHYDTKWMPDIRFVGANDGGSSTGFLLEMARVIGQRRLSDDVYLVWLDGEEAFGPWSDTDGIYGSRHLAAKWAASGLLEKMKAVVNIDMIGDRNLGILNDTRSSERLRGVLWRTAGELGYAGKFQNSPGAIEDDHIPFLLRGVHAVDLIDFDYGPNNAYWHTAQDTMDKLSADSFTVVGRVVLAALKKL